MKLRDVGSILGVKVFRNRFVLLHIILESSELEDKQIC